VQAIIIFITTIAESRYKEFLHQQQNLSLHQNLPYIDTQDKLTKEWVKGGRNHKRHCHSTLATVFYCHLALFIVLLNTIQYFHGDEKTVYVQYTVRTLI